MMFNYVTHLIYEATIGNLLSGVSAWAAALVYMGIIILTFIFLIMYIKRMITIAFLILISPIITITYSIDKMNDGKSQALDTWTKEFLQNVLIQPFHCIIYLVFISVAMRVVDGSGTLAAGLIVVITMFFIFEAEKIIKNIFGINADSTGSGMKTALTVVGTMTALKKLAEKSGKSSKPSQPKGNVNNVYLPQEAQNAKVNQSNVAANNLNAVAGAGNGKGTVNANINNVSVRNLSNQNLQNLGGAQVQDYSYLMDDDDDEDDNNPLRNVAKKMGLSGTIYKGAGNGVYTPNANLNKNAIANNPDANLNKHTEEYKVDNEPKKKISGFKKVLKEGAKKYMSVSYKGAMAFTAMTAQGISGDASPSSLAVAGVAGYQMGKFTQEKARQAYDFAKSTKKKAGQAYDYGKDAFIEQKRKITVKRKEDNLSNAYYKHMTSNNLSTQQMDRQTQEFMKMDSDSINKMEDETAQEYAKTLKSMQDVYANNGYDDPDNELQKTLNRIKNRNKNEEQKNRKNNSDIQRKNVNIRNSNINNVNTINNNINNVDSINKDIDKDIDRETERIKKAKEKDKKEEEEEEEN